MNAKYLLIAGLLVFYVSGFAATTPQAGANEQKLADYFRVETRRLAELCLADIQSLEDWKSRREELREQLFEMLSLSPLPPRTELNPVVTGKLEEELFTVENLHFQSMPGLYVTGNLYIPKQMVKPAPAILYVCGHAVVVTNGVSYGNKTAYQHHGAWFARNGYVCLTIDTVQLGEIQGIHHGTYREAMWWWNSRGYSSAGVEAWNCIRALDYLQSRLEVDEDRLGVTGRSGGGAYSWWVAALDDRVKAAAPVAGITDLQNHVVDGVVEGHCDCMFTVNTYRWDYAAVAALVAPRPLLICNSDKDSIFPLDGVVRVHSKVAKIYKLSGATNNLGLLITDGPHKDTQDLQLPVFRWFNRHLKREDPVIDMAATRFFSPAQLKVFDEIPSDERTSKIHESFVPLLTHTDPPKSSAEWSALRDSWKTSLKERVFRGWPQKPVPLETLARLQERRGQEQLDVYEFTSDHDIQLRLYVRRQAGPCKAIRLTVGGEQQWRDWITTLRKDFPGALEAERDFLRGDASTNHTSFGPVREAVAEAFFPPRGVGLSRWDVSERKAVQIRRRFMLLGQTLDGMRVWDIRQALQVIRSIPEFDGLPITVEGKAGMGVNALYAALFEPTLARLVLIDPPRSHREGPDYLNVMRFLDIPQAVAMAAEFSPVELRETNPNSWAYPAGVVSNLRWRSDALRMEAASREEKVSQLNR